MDRIYDYWVLDFLLTYGWAVAIGGFIYLDVFSQNYDRLVGEGKASFVCGDLEKTTNNKISVYSGILDAKEEIERTWNVRVVTLKGNTISMRQFDEDGVLCQMVVELCETGYSYCFDATMLIPVSYEEYEKWRD